MQESTIVEVNVRPPAWHSHRNSRTVYVADGAWLVQRRGGPVELVGPGQRVVFGPGEEHWHVAASDVAGLPCGQAAA